MDYLKATAFNRPFLMVESADHLTALTGATVTVKIGKNGGTGATAGGTVSEIDSTNLPGWYNVALTTTDTGTAGALAFHCTATSGDPTDFVDKVLDPAVAGYGVNVVNIAGSAAAIDGNNNLKVDVVDWGGTAVNGAIPPDTIFIRSGTAQAGAGSTITLDAGASATNNLYQNCVIFIRSGTGAGQSNIIGSYVGSTKVATVSNAWATNPDSTSVFTIASFGPVIASVSGTVTANVTQWLGSAVTAATAGVPIVSVTSNIKKNAASRLTFTMTDSTTHNPKTTLTVTGQVSIDGAAFVSLTNAVTEISNGDYTVSLAAADTNGNALMFRFTATAADDLNIFALTQP